MTNQKLTELIESTARRVADKVVIDIDEKTGLVCIVDKAAQNPGIVFRGDDYTQFMQEVNGYRTKAITASKHDCCLFVANDYIDCLWSLWN